NKMSVGECGALAIRAGVPDFIFLEVDAVHGSRKPRGASGDLPARHDHIERGKRAACYFRQHGGKDHVVFTAYHDDFDARRNVTELLGEGGARETTTYDDDSGLFHKCDLLTDGSDRGPGSLPPQLLLGGADAMVRLKPELLLQFL